MVFEWFSEKFNVLLGRLNTFEKIVNDNFGESKVVYWKAKGGSKDVDIRETLRCLGQTESMLAGVLKTIINNLLKSIHPS